MELFNPFLISGYQTPEYFCDREKETENLIDALKNGRNVTLISPRRMGKTGLIHHAFYQLKQQYPDIQTFYIDIFSTQNLREFIQLLAGTILGQLDRFPQKTITKISRFLKSLRPTLSFDEITGKPKVSIDIAPANEETILVEIFNYLQDCQKPCYIAIDEFQQIETYPEKGVEALLRSHIQFAPNIHFIFSGSKQHILQEMFLSGKRPFYQSTQTQTLGPIDKSQYYRFAARFFSKKKQNLTEEVFDYIYHTFEGHTWYIQNILNRLYSYATNPIDHATVNNALDQIIDESAYSYQNLLAAYPNSNTSLLKAIAKEGCVREINAGDFISRHQLRAASSVNSALKKLIDRELVYKTEQGYMVYDRFMAIWLRRQIF